MSTDVVSGFTWPRPVVDGAVRWEDCTLYRSQGSPPEPCRALVRADGAEFETYQPLNSSISLYYALAWTKPTEQDILRFVRHYGPLGAGVEERLVAPDGTVCTGEPLESWRVAILQTAEMVQVWELLQTSNTKALSQRFRWDGPERVYYWAPPEFAKRRGFPAGTDWVRSAYPFASSDRAPGMMADLSFGDVLRPAKLWLSQQLNDALRGSVRPQLVWTFTSRKDEAVLRDVPVSLLGAVYLQFASAVMSNRLSQPCQLCGQYFEVSPLISRNDRRTCSQKCRTYLYRRRQQQAKQLHADGKTLKQIAKELDTTVEKIKKWVSRTSKGE